MKQVIQSYKTGEVTLRDVPVPQCGSKRILVRNTHSLISLGTERSTIELGRKSLLGKAASRPDLVRRAWDKAKKEGLIKTWQEAMGRLDTPTPLGYSAAGVIEECGNAATEFAPGDRGLQSPRQCQRRRGFLRDAGDYRVAWRTQRKLEFRRKCCRDGPGLAWFVDHSNTAGIRLRSDRH